MANPLAKYFRQPGIHVTLPSGGAYSLTGEILLSSSNEVAILPMTAADEIIVSNPDSLLFGSALEQIILSCCPAVKNARTLPIPDVDVIIVAAKLVSYGDAFRLVAKCPSCQTAKEFSLSIRALLEQVKPLPHNHSVRLNDELIAYLRPYTLDSNTKISLAQFEQSKLIQAAMADNVREEERLQTINESFQKVTALNLELLSTAIVKIATPDTEVRDRADIEQFINNSSREVTKILKDGVLEFNNYGLPREVEVDCGNESCQHVWKTPLVYDPSSFFVSDS